MSKKWFGKKRVDAEDLAEMLGEAIDQAFERHLPSPDDIAGSIAKAIEDANFSTADQLGKVKASFVENQNTLTEKWVDVIGQLQQTQKAVTELPGQMQGVLSAETDRWKAVVGELGAQLDRLPAAHGESVEKTVGQMGEMFSQFTGTFADQVAEIKKTSEKLAEQLAGIGELTQGMDKILKVQESVDGLMNQVAGAEQMKKLFETIQSNIQENSRYLQEAAKPRVVRLVESEQE
jgi:methyl-accepting chemotaxis protein